MILSENRLPLFRIILERVADDAGKPFVEIVFVLGLLGLHHMGRGLAGHEFGAAALGEAA